MTPLTLDRTANQNGKRFEDLVRRILTTRDLQTQMHQPRGDRVFDLIGERDNQRWVIEVKFYRTARAQPGLLEAAAARFAVAVAEAGHNLVINHGMLVVSCSLPEPLRSSIQERYGIVLVDRFDLIKWAAPSPDLAQSLVSLLEAGLAPSDREVEPYVDPLTVGNTITPPSPQNVDTQGSDLCQKLKAIKRGRKGWAEYERICETILKYLFPDDLVGWHKQRRTYDGLNRYDFVCRIRRNTEFWNFLVDHLNSQYILFEFKNYSKKINQGQVLTTEKYMLKQGLRRVAIILTRAGADNSADKMIQGAMREDGKLMLVVNDKMLCQMLRQKQSGLDPTDTLFELTDEFLLRVDAKIDSVFITWVRWCSSTWAGRCSV